MFFPAVMIRQQIILLVGRTSSRSGGNRYRSVPIRPREPGSKAPSQSRLIHETISSTRVPGGLPAGDSECDASRTAITDTVKAITRARCPLIQPKRQSRTGSRGIAVEPVSFLKLRSRTNGSEIAHEALLTSICDFTLGRDLSFLITKPLISKDGPSCQPRLRTRRAGSRAATSSNGRSAIMVTTLGGFPMQEAQINLADRCAGETGKE
jgi:hypothetical protein